MNETPSGWPRIVSSLFYEDAASAIDFLCDAFGFRVRLRVDLPSGLVRHAQLVLGDGLIFVSSTRLRNDPGAELRCASPRALGGVNSQSLAVFVDDVDAHCAQALAAGASIRAEPETHDFGEAAWTDRIYTADDPEGHHWTFLQRLREGPGFPPLEESP